MHGLEEVVVLGLFHEITALQDIKVANQEVIRLKLKVWSCLNWPCISFHLQEVCGWKDLFMLEGERKDISARIRTDATFRGVLTIR